MIHTCPSTSFLLLGKIQNDTLFNLNSAGNILRGKVGEKFVVSYLRNHLLIFRKVREDVNKDCNAELKKSAIYLFFHSCNVYILCDCINLIFHFLSFMML